MRVRAWPRMLLQGKSAIITGSVRGIGRATAELFVQQGAKVLINDLDRDQAEKAANEIDGATATFVGDLTLPGACDDLIGAGLDAFGEVDIVVNNAGYLWDGFLHKMSDAQFQAMLDIHTIVPFRVIRALAPTWREAARAEADMGQETFRKIVNVTSVSGTMGNAAQVNYASAKAGVVGLTKAVAKEWGRFQINCNAVAFGTVETRLTQAREKGETVRAPGGLDTEIALGIPEEARHRNTLTIPLGRPARPHEAAGPILFLASELANYVHGQVLTVNGGKTTGMTC